MPIWSCTVFQINSKCLPVIETLLTTPAQHEYETWKRDANSPEEKMKIYIDSVTKTGTGPKIEFQMDRRSAPFFVRGAPGPQQFKVTARMGAQIFHVNGWPLLAGVFGQYQNAWDFTRAVYSIYKLKTAEREIPLAAVLFNLHEHDEKLLRCFPNMRKLRVSRIPGGFVKTATLSGEMLEQTSEYQKWVKDEDFGGQVDYFGVAIGDQTVVLSTRGNMYSRQGKQIMPVDVVYDVLKNLKDCNALVYDSSISSYT